MKTVRRDFLAEILYSLQSYGQGTLILPATLTCFPSQPRISLTSQGPAGKPPQPLSLGTLTYNMGVSAPTSQNCYSAVHIGGGMLVVRMFKCIHSRWCKATALRPRFPSCPLSRWPVELPGRHGISRLRALFDPAGARRPGARAVGRVNSERLVSEPLQLLNILVSPLAVVMQDNLSVAPSTFFLEY